MSFARRTLMTFLFVAAACSAFSKTRKTAPPNSRGEIKIGVSFDSVKGERWQTDRDTIEKRAGELGAKVAFEVAEGDDALQFEQSKKLIASGIKVLVIFPHNSETASRIVDYAHTKGVKVLAYDRLISNSDVDLYVGFDLTQVGHLQAEALVERVPKGNYVVLAGSQLDHNAVVVRDAQLAVLQPFVKRGDIKIIMDKWTKEWSNEEAYVTMTEEIEASKGEISAILASNDGLAGAAIQALADHQLSGKVAVSGQDADLSAIIRVLEGTQTMTVYKPVVKEATRAAETAVALAKGTSIDGETIFQNGTKKVPAILLEPIAVTKKNVKSTVIKDGFQTADSIKRGLSKDKWSLVE